jgi:hypothetical protein
VWTSQYGHGAFASEKITQGIREESSLRESTDENEVNVFWQFLIKLFKAGVAHKSDRMSFLFTPGGNDLRHDAREVSMHDPCPQCAGWPLTHKVNDANL